MDVLIALDSLNLAAWLKDLKSGACIITNQKNIEKLEAKGQDFSAYNLLPVASDDKYDNTYLISIFSKLLGLPAHLLEEKIAKIFAKK